LGSLVKYLVVTTGLGGLLIPVACILLSIAYSPWFNPWLNALSDLGRVSESLVAPIFNLGLALGGYLMGLFSIKYLIKYSVIKSVILATASLNLVLVAVFSEDYGALHFNVSLTFFTLLGTYLITDSLIRKSVIPAVGFIISLTLWLTHFMIKVPPGAAVPEVVSVVAFTTSYVRDYLGVSKLLLKDSY